jgi:hypothetical protein
MPETVALATSRILLIKEGDPRGAWTAVSLDYPLVNFGTDAVAAVRAFESATHALGPQLRPRKKPMLGYDNLFRQGDDVQLPEFQGKYQIRQVSPID